MSAKRAVIYARSATSETQTASLATQTKRCRAWAKKVGMIVVGQYQEAKGGKSPSLPVLEQAVTSARTQHAVVVCFDVSRLGRQSGTVDTRIAAMRQVGVTVVFVEADQ